MANEAEVKKLITSVLCSSPTGLTIRNLNYDFKNLVGYDVPYKNFGHPTLESYLRTIPDICEIRGYGDHAILIHVVTKNLEHMNALIINQKISKTGKRSVCRRPRGVKKQVKFYPEKSISIGYTRIDNDSASVCSASNLSEESYSEESNTSEQRCITTKFNCPMKYADLARYACKVKELKSPSKMTKEKVSKLDVTSKLKNRLKLIVKEYPAGLLSHRLPDVYKKKFNEDLDPFEFECSSISELCVLFNNELFYIIKPNRADLLLFDIERPKPNQEDYQKCNPFDINEYPLEVMILGEEFNVQTLYNEFKNSDCIPIKVVNIIDLSNFYIQYEFNNKFIKRRQQVFNDIQTFYLKNSQNYIVRNTHILHNLHCVVLVDDVFYRATIIKKISDSTEVFLVDYGDIEIVERNNLFYLMDEFTVLPKQAIYAGLSFLKPVTNSRWSRESINRFYQMVNGKKCVGVITSIDKTLDQINIIITDVTDDDVDVIINDTLIDECYAHVTSSC